MDRYLAGELSSSEIADLDGHLSTCPRCRSTMDEMRHSFAAFSPELPRYVVERVERQAPGPTRSARLDWRRWAPASLGALTIAAGLALWARGHVGSPTAYDSARERAKGGAHVAIFVQHAGAVRRASEGERVQPGDAIEFAYSSDRSGYLAVVSLDGARHATAYYEHRGGAVRIEPAREAPVDQTTVLDGTLGDESVYAVFCDHPFEAGPIERALEAQADRFPTLIGCVVDRHAIVKVAR
jgi:hypothetical protein